MGSGDSLYSELLSDLNAVTIAGPGPTCSKVQYIAVCSGCSLYNHHPDLSPLALIFPN